MITSGLYKAERHEGMFDDYEVLMTVKETPKSYCFTLESIDSRYCADHIRTLFSKSNHVVIRKKRRRARYAYLERQGFYAISLSSGNSILLQIFKITIRRVQ